MFILMMTCIYIKIVLTESYYRIKDCIDKIRNYFRKDIRDDDNNTIFSSIRYNPFIENDTYTAEENRLYVPEIIVQEPKSKNNLIDNWDIIDKE